MRRGTVDFG
jgi:hypothetical protein